MRSSRLPPRWCSVSLVPRGLQREAAGATALTLSVLGLLAVAGVLGGADADLAGGGALLGWAGRDADLVDGDYCRAAIGIGALALLGYLAIDASTTQLF